MGAWCRRHVGGSAVIIYMAVHPATHGFYYGKTTKTLSQRRQRHHADARARRGNSRFHKAIRKHGFDSFEWYTLEACSDRKALAERERFWIDLARRVGQHVYNLSDGGDGGGRSGSAGKSPTNETREKIAQSLRLFYKDRPGTMTGRKGNLSPGWGRTHSKEAREKISKATTGQSRPTIAGENNPSARAIRCLTTGELFMTATDAAVKYKTDLSSIVKCCKGRAKSAMGRKYAYAEPGVYGWTKQA